MMSAQVRRPNGALLLCLLLAVLLGAVLLSFGTGPLKLPAADVLRAMAAQFGLADPQSISARDMGVVWQLRIPRALLGAVRAPRPCCWSVSRLVLAARRRSAS